MMRSKWVRRLAAASAISGTGNWAASTALALAVAQPYRLQRLVTFLDPWSDPQKYGFQTIQMLYALGLGGPFGEGLGAGERAVAYRPSREHARVLSGATHLVSRGRRRGRPAPTDVRTDPAAPRTDRAATARARRRTCD